MSEVNDQSKTQKKQTLF